MIVFLAVFTFVLSLGILYFIRMYLTGGRLSSGDTFFHLLISRSIRENQWKYPLSLRNVIFGESDKNYDYLAYPPLLHYITALFPIRFHLKIAKNFNLFVLSLVSSIAAIFAYNLTSNLGLAILSSFIVAFNLSAFDLVTQFSPRSLGLFFYSLVACIAVFYPQNLFSLLAITLLVALTSLTHKFAVQALIFGFIPYAIIFNKPYLILSFALGFVLAILISRGFYLGILKEHVNWLRFYNFRRKVCITYDLTTIFSRNFWYLQIVISIFFVFVQNGGSLLHTDLIAKVTFWAFINILIALLVLMPALSAVGEYYRYVEYSVVPVGISVVTFVADLNPYVLLISLVCISISFLSLFKFKRYLNCSKVLVNPDDILSYGSLRNYGLTNLLVIPHTRTMEVNYFTELSVVHPVRGTGNVLEFFGNLIDRYQIEYLLKFKDTDPFQVFETLKNAKEMKKILDFTNFEVYKMTPKTDLNSLNPPPAD